MKPSTSLAPVAALLIVLAVTLSTSTVHGQSATELWNHEIGGQIWAPLAHHEGQLYFGSDDSTFYAFDIAGRDVAWRFGTGGIIRSGAEIARGTVLFASDDGYLYALEADSGAEIWRVDLGSSALERVLPDPGPPYEYDYMHSTPVHRDGVIYVGSADGALYAVDLETGKHRWRFGTGGKIRSTPVVDTGIVYFGSWDHHVYALEAADGSQLWRFDTGNIVQGSPALGDGKLFVGSRAAAVFAVDAGTGEQVWKHVHADGSWVESSPVFDDGVVYIGSSDALALFALDAGTGETSWRFETGGWSWSTPVLAGGTVYIGSLSAFPYYFEGVDLNAGLFAVDQATGEPLWSFTPESVEGYVTGGVFSSPAIADGVIYVAGVDGRLHAFEE